MKRILFVDDEEQVLEGIEDLLRPYRRKWKMCFVNSGTEALDCLAEQSFDVLVTDMRMPGMDGAALLSSVQASHPNMIRIILSGHTEMAAALRAVPIAHQFLAKPAASEQVENVIARATGLQALIGDESVRSVVAKLEKLPSVPRIYQAVTNALTDERTTNKQISALMEQDPAICAKILQIVNSSFFGMARRITSIEHAVSILGFAMVKNLVMAAEVFVSSDYPQIRGFSADAVQRHAFHTAGVAKTIAGSNKRLAEDAFMASILHDIGKLVIALELPEQLEKSLEIAEQQGRELHDVERELAGVTHAEVGAYLLGIWGLPYTVVEAVANHHEPQRVQQKELDTLAVVHVANELINEQQCGRPATGLEEYLEKFGLAGELGRWRASVGSSGEEGAG